MSGMYFWAPQLLFMWQLLWLLVQARPLPELALDPNLLTATTLGLTEPWPQDQQNLAEEPSYAPGEAEFPSQQKASALQTEAPAEMKISPTPQEDPAQQPEVPEEEEAFFTEEEPIEVPPKKGSTTLQVHFASAELSAGNEEGPTQPPETPKVTFLHPESIQAQQPTPPKIAVESVDPGLTVTPHPTEEAEQPTTLHQTTAPPEHPEVTPSHRGPPQAQQPTPPKIAVESVDPGLTITPQPTEKAEQRTTLQQTIVSPEHPEVALSHPASVQGQKPTLPGDMEGNKSLQPEPSGLVPLTTEEKATMSVCKLCTCRNETLSCVALGPKQRLRSVPVLQPSTDNDTFTTLDLRGNAISSLDENTWKSYQHIEKLILSGNEITELKKDSFKGLLFLKYLDLSCNKIKFIERNTFESLPFLQHLNLSCNSLEKLSLRTFEAWHRMQFLYKIILNRNPLTTVEDPYLFELPALKYLDLGTTQVSLKTVETVIMKTPELEKLILPSRLSCCLCQFKDSIEAVSETVKLHCETACVGNTLCDEELSTAKATLIDAVKSHRKSTSTELTIEPEKTSPETRDNKLSTFLSEQLGFNDTSDVLRALGYTLPYFLEGNLEDRKTTLLNSLFQMYKLAICPSRVKSNRGNPTLKSEFYNSRYKNN
ncbi:leucine-rich repeat-containing protein 37B-like [Rhynchonycteris naso]